MGHRKVISQDSRILTNLSSVKSQSMARVPKVTVSLTRPRHLRAHPSREHIRPHYLSSSPSGCAQSFKILVARRDTPDPLSNKNQTLHPATCPKRYSPFPTSCISFFASGPASTVTAVTVPSGDRYGTPYRLSGGW